MGVIFGGEYIVVLLYKKKSLWKVTSQPALPVTEIATPTKFYEIMNVYFGETSE
jgi:hypothetical protein